MPKPSNSIPSFALRHPAKGFPQLISKKVYLPIDLARNATVSKIFLIFLISIFLDVSSDVCNF